MDERTERWFAHLYDTGGIAAHPSARPHEHPEAASLIHAGGFNLGLVMRHLIGIGTPRGIWRADVSADRATLGVLMRVVRRRPTSISGSQRHIPCALSSVGSRYPP